MAVSPLILPPTSALQNGRTVSSPLKNAASAQTSSNGTPQATQVVPDAAAGAAQSASLDLAEQLNEDEKRKYVKGL